MLRSQTIEVRSSASHETKSKPELIVDRKERGERTLESAKKKMGRSMDERPRQRISKSAPTLQSVARRRTRSRHGASSLPLRVEFGSSHPLDTAKPSYRNAEEICGNKSISTLIYATPTPASSSSGDNNCPHKATSNIQLISNSNSKSNVPSSVRSASSLVRTTSVITARPSTLSRINAGNQDCAHVIDPVWGTIYRKEQFLGKGGFGKVYLVKDVESEKEFACKIMATDQIRRVAREIMIHRKLIHENVVQIYHAFEDRRNVYIFLEVCPRKSLMHVLKDRRTVTQLEARYYMKQMVNGVAYIHSQKIVHRDLKPGNIFLSINMVVKIGDFGLATILHTNMTRVNICGTPNYIAPEVLYKQAYSYEADVWALGCILYALLVGHPPFDTATLQQTYAKIRDNNYQNVDDTIASRNCQDLIRQLLLPNPMLRPTLDEVKRHRYLTKEYVPETLPPKYYYQVPAPSVKPTSRYQHQHQHQHQRQQENTNPQKESSWLVKKLPKVPRFRQRLLNVICPDNKKVGSRLYRVLEACIHDMKHSCRSLPQKNPEPLNVAPLFVAKWVDYSNKYGMGFQLSDNSVGVLFNDNTKISYTEDRRKVEYVTADDRVFCFDIDEDIPAPLLRKLKLLKYFTVFMGDNMTDGGEVKQVQTQRQSKKTYVPRMTRWLRTDKLIVMEFSAPLLQVNFLDDHTKITISQVPTFSSSMAEYWLTYIDTSRHTWTYLLFDIRDFGCTLDLYQRLCSACKAIRELYSTQRND